MSREIRFLVIGGPVSKPHGAGFAVAGRCLDGPILVGDQFREVQDGESIEPVRLVVEEISPYGKLLGQLDPVVTGELVLSGTPGPPLADHAVLAGRAAEQ
jgi:hypothetical protein